MWTGNAMQLLAQQNRAMKDKQAAAKAEELRTNLRTGIISVIETLPPIQDGQKPPNGSATENRTPVYGMKTRCPNH
jgi:hypothetical protein